MTSIVKSNSWKVRASLINAASFCALQVFLPQLSAQVNFTSTPSAELQPSAPLAGLLSFGTDVPAKASYRVRTATPGEAWLVESSSFETSHSLPVLGMAPGTEYFVDQIRVEDGSGMTTTYSTPLSITTAPLPNNFPAIDVRKTAPDRVEPGYTYIPSRADDGSYSMALDVNGDVRWYIEGNASDLHLSNGLLLGRLDGSVVEMDFLGNIHRSWHSNTTNVSKPGSVPVDAFNFHHDVQRMPNGNFLTISQNFVELEDFPTDVQTQNDPNTHGAVRVRDDPIVEFAPDGTVVNQWNMLDMLDTTRLGYDTFQPNGTADWVHNNAVVYDPSDDSITVSSRHQDAVFKFSRATGDLKWILSDHANWAPEFEQYLLTPVVEAGEEFSWPYHQHAPMYLPDGNLLLFDNHNFGVAPPEDVVPHQENVSRAVEYKIDEDAKTITQVWEHGPDEAESVYAIATGDADWMPNTNNILISYGLLWGEGGVQSFPDSTPLIIEVDRAGNRLFEAAVGDPGEMHVSYRAEKFPSLYGPEFAVTAVPEASSLVYLTIGCTLLVRTRRKTRIIDLPK